VAYEWIDDAVQQSTVGEDANIPIFVRIVVFRSFTEVAEFGLWWFKLGPFQYCV
jgi:hypothetical protein